MGIQLEDPFCTLVPKSETNASDEVDARAQDFKAAVLRALSHPAVDQVSLSVVLHALADPVRLEILRTLAATEALSCADSCATFKVARATLSRHYDVLRSAGLVHTRKDGVMYRNTLRRAELEQRFPGLLDVVLGAMPGPTPLPGSAP